MVKKIQHASPSGVSVEVISPEGPRSPVNTQALSLSIGRLLIRSQAERADERVSGASSGQR